MNNLFLLLLVFLNVFDGIEKVNLKVTVTNINTLKGCIELGIYNDTESFPERNKEYRTYSKKVQNDTVIFVLKNLIKDDYAIALFHDVNSDKKCNLNFLGIPTEAYGFSRNYKPVFSKPSFYDCKIKIDRNMSISINLID